MPIDEFDFSTFVATLRSEIALEIKKKWPVTRAASRPVVSAVLWDTPIESRTINDQTEAVLRRRAAQIPLPQRIALLDALASR